MTNGKQMRPKALRDSSHPTSRDSLHIRSARETSPSGESGQPVRNWKKPSSEARGLHPHTGAVA